MSRLALSASKAGTVVLFLVAAPVLAQQSPPVAPVREVVDTYFGHSVTDPYRWMEDKTPELDAWMKAQNTYTRSVLDRLPLRSRLFDRFMEVTGASTAATNFQRSGNKYFSLRRSATESDYSLYMRDSLTGRDRLLISVAGLSQNGRRSSIANYSVSPDGRYVSYLVSPGGGEYGSLHILDLVTHKNTADRIAETRWSAGTWLPDSKSLAYVALQKLAPGAPPTERIQKGRVLIHKLGTDESSDRPIFGWGVDPAISSPPTMIPFADIPRDSKYAYIYQNAGVEPVSEVYVVPVDKLGESRIPWTKLATFDDEVSNVWVHGDDLFVQTNKNAPRSKIVRTSITKPDLAHATMVYGLNDAVLVRAGTARDAFYVQTASGGLSRIHRIHYNDGKVEAVTVKDAGSVDLESVEPDRDGALLNIQSWTKSSRILDYNPTTKVARETNLRPASPVDMSSIVSKDVMVTSWDGTKVPMVILHKRGLKMDGTNPTIIEGYGAYGVENVSPVFASFVLPWLERGGVYASPGVRGGGEYGEEWHLAGKGKNKPNTWKDFIAGAEYLVKNKYTSPAHLAGRGTSAGGILIGNAIAERPDLFGLAFINVGITNALRYETTPNGPGNIPEFGSVTTEQGFNDLLAMDAYGKIKKGVRYPAVFILTGANDPRVEPWISAKMAARLQAATSSGRPVLLSVDYDAGHGSGLTREQTAKRNADFYAFAFDQLTGPAK